MLEGKGEAGDIMFSPLEAQEGKITTTLQCSSTPSPAVAKPSLSPLPSLVEEKNSKKRGGKKKRLEALLSYQQRLVVEKRVATQQADDGTCRFSIATFSYC